LLPNYHTIVVRPVFTAILCFLRFHICLLLLLCPTHSQAQVTFTDNFDIPLDYLTNGVTGTIWDGIYLGAGEIAGATGVGTAAGSVSTFNASISSNNVLTIASLQTDWENAADDGVFLYKVVTGDFDMRVRVLGPIDTGSYNLPGLMVRAFGAGGAPAPNNAENSFLWGRFDEFSIANMLKNNLNGAKTDTAEGTYPNSNYWLRIQRIGNIFYLSESSSQPGLWVTVGSVTRADFSGRPLQVGIEHSDYGGGVTRSASYASFSLTVSNLSLVPPPEPATGLIIQSTPTNATLSWTPGAGSSGSLVLVWSGGSFPKQAPASGTTYNGDPRYGFGDTLPAAGYYVVYSGSGNSVTVTNLSAGSAYNVAVFSYAGSGSSTTYTNQPAAGLLLTQGAPVGQLGSVTVDPTVPLTNYTSLGEWNTDGNFENWTTSQVSSASVSNGILSATASGSDPYLALLNFANGPDLDLAFNDYIDLRLQAPTGFSGNILLYYGVTNTPGISSSRLFTIPNASIPQDGQFHVYRIFIGPQVFWRGNLRDLRLDPLGAAASAGQTFAVDYVRVGDLYGDSYYPRYSANCPQPGQNDTANNLPVSDMQSKHFRVIWDNWDVTNFPAWKPTTPHGTLRNLEECWKNHIWKLGYTEPVQSWNPALRDGKKYKVNLTMYYGGYFSGGDVNNFGWLNITPDGLQVDPPTWVPPHEFGHVCQMHQNPNGAQNVDGQFWEHHANYVRERWIYYYGPNLPGWGTAQSNLDPNYSYLSHFWIGHGRDYYLCWPFFLYLDENPDALPDLGEGFVPKIWQTAPAGEYMWSSIARLAPHNSVQDIIGYVARRNVMWDYSHRAAIQAAENTGDQELLQRWVYAELRPRLDDPTWMQAPMEFAPQQTGYKIHRLTLQGTGAGRIVTVNFHGLPYTNSIRYADWRASFVVVSDSGAIRYSSLWNAGSNSMTLAANENTVFLAVAGTPNQFLSESIDDMAQPYQSAPSKARFPYELQLFGATPNENTNSTSGLVQLPLSQGGGWRSTTATVAPTAYVGPNARVLGNAQVLNNARILDFAIVEGTAQVLNNAVISGHALVRNSAVVRDNAKVRDYATIIDTSVVRGNARVLQRGQLTGGSAAQDWATIKGSASTWRDTSVDPNQFAGGDAVLDGDFSTARTVTNGFQFGFKEYDPGPMQWITNRTAPRRLYADYEFASSHASLVKDFYGVTDGYLQGNPLWISSDGKRSGFLSFNGANQFVVLDRSLSDLNEISVTAWIKWNGGAPNQPAWFFGAATNQCMYFTPNDGTHARFVIRTNAGGDQSLIAPAPLSAGIWTHVAVTLSNGIMGRLYINGILQQQSPITIAPDQLNAPNANTNIQHNYIARGPGSFLPFFNGSLDSVRIYTGALTTNEINALQVPNQTPVLAAVANATINPGFTLVVTNSATDPDQPWQTLTFTLLNAPAGASLNNSNGLFTWRAPVASANTTNIITLKVSDNGTPSLSATQSFFVIVSLLAQPTFSAPALINGSFSFQVNGQAGPDYTVQVSTNLADWSALFTTNSPPLPFSWTDPNPAVGPVQFYRLLLGP
jgi:carbonic anhydrase/acetyltransferase-like protein (isoleucine patch superfamily)